jgi:hypothetical protein
MSREDTHEITQRAIAGAEVSRSRGHEYPSERWGNPRCALGGGLTVRWFSDCSRRQRATFRQPEAQAVVGNEKPGAEVRSGAILHREFRSTLTFGTAGNTVGSEAVDCAPAPRRTSMLDYLEQVGLSTRTMHVLWSGTRLRRHPRNGSLSRRGTGTPRAGFSISAGAASTHAGGLGYYVRYQSGAGGSDGARLAQDLSLASDVTDFATMPGGLYDVLCRLAGFSELLRALYCSKCVGRCVE